MRLYLVSRLMIFVLPCFNGVTFKVVYEDSRDQHLPTFTVVAARGQRNYIVENLFICDVSVSHCHLKTRAYYVCLWCDQYYDDEKLKRLRATNFNQAISISLSVQWKVCYKSMCIIWKTLRQIRRKLQYVSNKK